MPAVSPTKYVVSATWDDAPHLTPEQKQELWESIPPHQRDARSKGVPQLGAGAIFPVPESKFVVEPFELPEVWPLAFGMDFGWKCTAALWGAWDRYSDVIYLFSEYKAGQSEPPVHADAIKARGSWMTGAADPASRGASQKDGQRLIDDYRSLGINLVLADNAVESGIFKVFRRLVTGRLKVFNTLREFLSEYRLYRRDEKGKVVKDNDHLMDCLRYLIMTGMYYAKNEIEATWDTEDYWQHTSQSGKNKITGY